MGTNQLDYAAGSEPVTSQRLLHLKLVACLWVVNGLGLYCAVREFDDPTMGHLVWAVLLEGLILLPITLLGTIARVSTWRIRASVALIGLLPIFVFPMMLHEERSGAIRSAPDRYFRVLMADRVPESVRDLRMLPSTETAGQNPVLRFKISAFDLDRILSSKAFVRVYPPRIGDPVDRFTDGLGLRLGTGDELFCIDDRNHQGGGDVVTLRVNSAHTEAILLWQVFHVAAHGRIWDAHSAHDVDALR